MNQIKLSTAIESIILSVNEPIGIEQISELTEASVMDCETEINELNQKYNDSESGFYIAHVGGGYCYSTIEETSTLIEKYVLMSKRAIKLSGPALETLAIVAYKQPVSKAQISAIRGVNADGAVSALLEKDYIEEYGRDSGPGNAILYATTNNFLLKLGINSIADLPPISAFIPDRSIVEALEKGLMSSDE